MASGNAPRFAAILPNKCKVAWVIRLLVQHLPADLLGPLQSVGIRLLTRQVQHSLEGFLIEIGIIYRHR